MGTIKARVYAHNPATVQELEAAIRCEFAKISAAELRKAVRKLPTRLHAVLLENGGVIEHLM